jgi:hypothetical protein
MGFGGKNTKQIIQKVHFKKHHQTNHPESRLKKQTHHPKSPLKEKTSPNKKKT